jgi:hypothetical protein
MVAVEPLSPSVPASPEVGAYIRSLRKNRKLSLRDVVYGVADGPSLTQLQGIESGQRPARVAHLERIADFLEVDVLDILQQARRLPDAVAEELMSPELVGVLGAGGLVQTARRSLRRVHLDRLADNLRPAEGFPRDVKLEEDGGIYDTLQLDYGPEDGLAWSRFGTTTVVRYPSTLDAEPGLRPERRYQLAHLAAHVAIAGTGRVPRCHRETGGPDEEEAVYLAGVLLVPGPMLRTEFDVYVGSYDPRLPEKVGGLVGEVASGFSVPAWLAANRLVQEGLLSYAAGEEVS